MSSLLFSKLPSLGRTAIINHFIPILTCQNNISTSSECFGSRRGTRERKAKLKKEKSKEVVKVGWIPENQRKRNIVISNVDKHLDDDWMRPSVDDVYLGRLYPAKRYSIIDGIKCHKETHDPTMYNALDAKLNVRIELNMQGERSTRFLDGYYRMALMPHGFDTGKARTILIFTDDKDEQQKAMEAGATYAGGKELIKSIQAGEVNLKEYEFFGTHPSFMSEVIPLRGLLKKKFPNVSLGTINEDLPKMIKRLLNAVDFKAFTDEHQKNFGYIETVIGTLNMETEHLAENFKTLLSSVEEMRPKRRGKYITRCFLTTLSSKEIIRVDPFEFVEMREDNEDVSDGEESNVDSDIEDADDKVKSAKKIKKYRIT